MLLTLFVLLALLHTNVECANSDLDDYVRISVVGHTACPVDANWVRKIEFPNGTISKLEQDPARPNCYNLGGDVMFFEKIVGELQLHLEISHDISGDDYRPDPCIGYDNATGCGGAGSWFDV